MFISFSCLGEGNKMAETVDLSRPWRNYFLDSKASFMHGNLWLLGADCESTQTDRFSTASKVCWMQQIYDGMQPGSIFCPRLREYRAQTRKCFYLSQSGTTCSHNTTREAARVCCAPATSLASSLQE